MSTLHSGHFGGAFLLLVGVVLSVWAIRERAMRIRRVAGFLRAEGRVVEVESLDDPAFVGDLFVMGVRFRAASGEETTLRLSRRDGRATRLGDKITIRYPAGSPARGEAEGWSLLESVAGLAMSVLLAVLGALLLYVSIEPAGQH